MLLQGVIIILFVTISSSSLTEILDCFCYWHRHVLTSQKSLQLSGLKWGFMLTDGTPFQDTYRRRQMQRTITRQMSFDLTKLLVTEDWFSDISPQTMRRLLNIVSVTGGFPCCVVDRKVQHQQSNSLPETKGWTVFIGLHHRTPVLFCTVCLIKPVLVLIVKIDCQLCTVIYLI